MPRSGGDASPVAGTDQVGNAFLTAFRDIIASGLGRNIGNRVASFGPLDRLPDYSWAEDRQQAEDLQQLDELADFLLFLRPEGAFSDRDLERQFDLDMNEIAARVREPIADLTKAIHLSGITNDPVGFGASDVIETFRSIAISGAQEKLAEARYGLVDPLPCRDHLRIYDDGRILCGYLPEDGGRIVFN